MFIIRMRFTRFFTVSIHDRDCSNALTREGKVEQRNKAYYAKYPEDAKRVKRIMRYLGENQPQVSSGKITPARFQQMGILFGAHGKSALIHRMPT